MSTRDAMKRLGARFARCSQCRETYIYQVGPDAENFAVMSNQAGDYDEGTNEVFLCCSNVCAQLKVATVEHGFVWRSGKCGGTVMP